MNLFYAQGTTLPDNFRCKIDLVVRRANAWAELHDHVRGVRSKACDQLVDYVGDNAERGAFAAGMHEADSRSLGIDDVNGAAVGNVNAQGDAALIRYDAVTAGKFAAYRAAAPSIENCDLVSVDLFGGEERPIANTDCLPNFAMRGIEPLQRFGFSMQNIDAGNSLREYMATDSNRAQRGKLLERKLHYLSFNSQGGMSNIASEP